MRMGLFSKRGGRIIEHWSFDAKAPLISGAAIAQSGARHMVIFGTKDGMVIAVDEDGKQLWSFVAGEKLKGMDEFFVDTERAHSIDAQPTIADIDLDGKEEILFGTELGTLFCLNLEGKLLWKHETGGSIRAGALVADINNDGRPEILIGSTNNKLSVLTNQGKKLFEYMTDAPVESIPGVLKGKKILIIFGNNRGTLTAITPAQDVVWKAELEHRITAAPSFLSDPEEMRLVIGTTGGNLFCISEHGEHVWTFKTNGSIYSAAAIADINEDNKPEILIGSCDNTIYAISDTGQRIWSYETDFWITGTPIVADIDGDGKLEVVAGSYDHNIYVLDSQGTYSLDYVPGLSGIVPQAGHYSNILTSDPGEQIGKKLYQFKTDGIVVGCTLLQKRDKPSLVVNVKTGKVNTLKHES